MTTFLALFLGSFVLLTSCTNKGVTKYNPSAMQKAHGYALSSPLVPLNIPKCEEIYRGVYIDCRPRDHKWMDAKHQKSAEQLRISCREYVDRTISAHGISGSTKYGCHQMDGGPLVIDGIGQ